MNDGHLENWIDAIRSGRRSDLTAEIQQGHLSSGLCYLGNIAMLLGRKLRWDPERERFVGDPAANRMLSRPMREPWSL